MTIVRHPQPGYTGAATIRGRTMHFKDGTAEADGNLAGFRRAGYTLNRSADLESLTVAELREHAAERDIDLTGANRKAEILHAIKQDNTEE